MAESEKTSSIRLPSAHSERQALSVEDKAVIQALPRENALLVGTVNSGQSARFLLDLDSNLIGRSPQAQIFLDDVTVSRKHASVERINNSSSDVKGFILKDLGSLNGTYLNQVLIESEMMLGDGDEIQIGKFRLNFYGSKK
jgi:pSer/pThr/pTyr-binding forkhead associated (FHA) protein